MSAAVPKFNQENSFFLSHREQAWPDDDRSGSGRTASSYLVHSFNTRSTHREVFVRATSVRDKHLLAGEEDGVRALQPVGHVVRVEDRDLSRGDDDVFSTTIQPPYSLLKIHRFFRRSPAPPASPRSGAAATSGWPTPATRARSVAYIPQKFRIVMNFYKS